MLETQERKLFLDVLQPPLGYKVDYIVGTTYSLDILALMTVPLSITMNDWHDTEGRPSMNPLALLEAMRRHSDNIILFCQAGMMKVPKRHRAIFAYLEDCISEVKAPKDTGVFHPKVWVGRYTSEDGPTRYKVIVQSRNLTFDRSWDMMLVLDGEVIDRKNAFSKNHPLGDFIKILPDLAIRQLSPEKSQKVELIQNEIRRVHFETPEPFTKDEISFWPLGIDGYHKWPFAERRDRSLVVSPFLSGSFLQKFSSKGKDHLLVTKIEELAKISEDFFNDFSKVLVLKETTDPEPNDHMGGESNIDDEDDKQLEVPSSTPENEGLHAKMYIADQGWESTVWLGSANATSHAFEKNVEFLVELRGKKRWCGIDAFLGSVDTKGSFMQLLQEYSLNEHEVDVESIERKELEKQLEMYRIQISSAPFTITVEEGEGQNYYLRLLVPSLRLHDDVTIKCWPLSLKEKFTAVALKQNEHEYEITFGPIELKSITSFFAFSITIPYKSEELDVRFLSNFPLYNVPDNRKEQILHNLLKNKEQFLRYLMLLLADNGLYISDMDALIQTEGENGLARSGSGTSPFPLFEMMMKTLRSNPEQLDQINEIVEGLRKTPEGQALLPKDFDSIWEPIWAVRKEMIR